MTSGFGFNSPFYDGRAMDLSQIKGHERELLRYIVRCTLEYLTEPTFNKVLALDRLKREVSACWMTRRVTHVAEPMRVWACPGVLYGFTDGAFTDNPALAAAEWRGFANSKKAGMLLEALEALS